jgi:hypothetical protein
VAYLAASSVGFTEGSIGLYQVLASRLAPASREILPTTREETYAAGPPARQLARAS